MFLLPVIFPLVPVNLLLHSFLKFSLRYGYLFHFIVVKMFNTLSHAVPTAKTNTNIFSALPPNVVSSQNSLNGFISSLLLILAQEPHYI